MTDIFEFFRAMFELLKLMIGMFIAGIQLCLVIGPLMAGAIVGCAAIGYTTYMTTRYLIWPGLKFLGRTARLLYYKAVTPKQPDPQFSHPTA